MTDIHYLASIMKNRLLNIALLYLIIAFTSCNKITESIQQDIIVNDTVYFEIPTLDSGGSAPAEVKKQTLRLEEEIKKSLNNFTPENIKATNIKSLFLALLPIEKDSIDAKNNFGNLGTIKFNIAANGNISNIANTSITSSSVIDFLSLTPGIQPETLKPILINPSKTYDIIVKAKAPTTTPMIVAALATYTITLSK